MFVPGTNSWGPQRRPLQISPRGPSLCQKQRPEEEVTQATGESEAAALEIGATPETTTLAALIISHPRSSHASSILFFIHSKNNRGW